MRLHEALLALSQALACAAMRKDALGEATRDMEWAHLDEVVALSVADEREGMNRVLAAYAAAIEAAAAEPHGLPPVPLVEDAGDAPMERHLRAERRFVARLDSRILVRFSRSYRELAEEARHHAQEGASS